MNVRQNVWDKPRSFSTDFPLLERVGPEGQCDWCDVRLPCMQDYISPDMDERRT